MRSGVRLPLLVLLSALAGGVGACDKPKVQAPATQPALTEKWQSLFDGKGLTGWKVSDFAGAGKVQVKDGAIDIGMGSMCTGVRYDPNDPKAPVRPLPRENYELTLEGRRMEGQDFFCGLTFPVGKDPISLILGGWGGTMVGLSSLNGMDASENETSQSIEFQKGRWYRVDVRVTKTHIRVWVDDNKIIDVAREGKRISIRYEMEPSVPLGVATWQTRGAIRDVRIRRLTAAEADPDAP
jgi:hypothetical protein